MIFTIQPYKARVGVTAPASQPDPQNAPNTYLAPAEVWIPVFILLGGFAFIFWQMSRMPGTRNIYTIGPIPFVE
jgi:hypothetical protein